MFDSRRYCKGKLDASHSLGLSGLLLKKQIYAFSTNPTIVIDFESTVPKATKAPCHRTRESVRERSHPFHQGSGSFDFSSTIIIFITTLNGLFTKSYALFGSLFFFLAGFKYQFSTNW